MTLFNDGLGRTISRDANILQALLTQYRNSNLMLLAQAGIEIEYLQSEIKRLEGLAAVQKMPILVVPKVIKSAVKKD